MKNDIFLLLKVEKTHIISQKALKSLGVMPLFITFTEAYRQKRKKT